MKQRLRLWASLIGSLSSVVALGIVVAPSIAGLIVGLQLGKHRVLLTVLFSCGGLVVGLGATTAVAFALQRRRARSIDHQRGYRTVRAEYVYSINADDPHLHQQDVLLEIEALRDGVTVFYNQYWWTGKGTDRGPEIRSTGHRLIEPPRTYIGWQAYTVDLGRPLRKNERETVAIRQRMTDTEEAFESVLAKAVHEELDRLVLEVDLPRRFRPNRVWLVTRRGDQPGSDQPDQRLEPTTNSTKELGMNSIAPSVA